jgi:hypothetical protein
MARSRSRLVAPAALAALVLATTACGLPDNTPAAYDDQVKAEFVQGCTGRIPETDGTTTTLASTDFCGCAYDAFVENIPYNEDSRGDHPGYSGITFVDFNNELKSEPTTPMPQVVADQISADCPAAGPAETQGGDGPVVGPTVPDASTSTTGEPSAN